MTLILKMVLIVLAVGALLGFLGMMERWDYDECMRVGHTARYCVVNHPLGAHRLMEGH